MQAPRVAVCRAANGARIAGRKSHVTAFAPSHTLAQLPAARRRAPACRALSFAGADSQAIPKSVGQIGGIQSFVATVRLPFPLAVRKLAGMLELSNLALSRAVADELSGCLQLKDRRSHIPPEYYKNPLQRMFQRFDDDSDGYLTAKQVYLALASNGIDITEAQVDTFLSAADLQLQQLQLVSFGEFEVVVHTMAEVDLAINGLYVNR